MTVSNVWQLRGQLKIEMISISISINSKFQVTHTNTHFMLLISAVRVDLKMHCCSCSTLIRQACSRLKHLKLSPRDSVT